MHTQVDLILLLQYFKQPGVNIKLQVDLILLLQYFQTTWSKHKTTQGDLFLLQYFKPTHGTSKMRSAILVTKIDADVYNYIQEQCII